MEYKNKCCNQLESYTTNSPTLSSNLKPYGLLLPGGMAQTCFNLNKLPNIETVKDLAFELCNVQLAFDKCPQYYTKQDYEKLLNTLNSSLFHLYVTINEMVDCPWFMGLASLDTNPLQQAEINNRDLPGYYIAENIGIYEHFIYAEGVNSGKPIEVTKEELENNLIFLKPVLEYGKTFIGYEKIVVKLGDIEEIRNSILNLKIEVERDISDIFKNIQNIITAINKLNVDLQYEVSQLQNEITYNLNYIQTVENNVENIDDRVTILEGKTVGLQLEVTYSDLVNLITNSQLNPGQEYKITDYTFTTTQKDTSSAHHDFDIIVIADTINTLNEQAKACKKEGDSYFDNNNLSAWELKYSVYNNINKYSWADETSGKGVIYYLKDEFNNEAGFDFKSALFTKSVLVSYDKNYNAIDPTLKGCSEYLAFHGLRNETIDKSLTGDFYNVSITFLKELPYIKLINSGNNIKIDANSAYIYQSSDIELLNDTNYISSSLRITVNGLNNIVISSNDCLISKSSIENRIVNCKDVKLGFENNANYLEYCSYLTVESYVSSLNIKNWEYCKIEADCDNIQSSGFWLKYSTIGYNNENIILKSSGNVYYKTIAPNTFDTSLTEQFEFNQNNLDKFEIISKSPLMTYVD